MHKIIPILGCAAIIGLVNLKNWHHITHHKQVRDVIVVCVVFAVLEVVALIVRARWNRRKAGRQSAPAAPAVYALPGRRR